MKRCIVYVIYYVEDIAPFDGLGLIFFFIVLSRENCSGDASLPKFGVTSFYCFKINLSKGAMRILLAEDNNILIGYKPMRNFRISQNGNLNINCV